ncbi:protein SSUH2 homolog [Pseudophryne corroboree]|uniref:protein SSUH2 homolog n=1 Tax=Pseudophryne corroboree TaxID=495146 RepID=UPI0030814C7D
MAEHSGLSGGHSAAYGAMEQPYQPNYLMTPDIAGKPLIPGYTHYPEGMMASAAMSPPYYPPADATSPAVDTDGPTAPLPEWTDIPGYEGMGAGDGGGKFLPPPDMGPIPGAVPTPTNADWTVPSISEDDARKALLDYAKSKCCYRSTAAEGMNFQKLQPFNTYRYRLETFTESRACAWVTTPYTGQPVDSSAYGPAPQPWEIPVQIPSMFQDKEMKIPVPRTSSVKACPQCLGTCKTVCRRCHGRRKVKCLMCHGAVRRMNDRCHHCRGSGKQRCTTCHGSGHVTCTGCSGHGQILNYIELTVTWKNNIYEFVADHNSEFSTELFTKVNGERIFTDEQLLLPPLNNFPDPAINQASLDGLQQHHAQFAGSCRILRQRHGIEWLPLTKVVYIWKGNRYDYFVYGKENKVYTDNYPQKCCCAVM